MGEATETASASLRPPASKSLSLHVPNRRSARVETPLLGAKLSRASPAKLKESGRGSMRRGSDAFCALPGFPGFSRYVHQSPAHLRCFGAEISRTSHAAPSYDPARVSARSRRPKKTRAACAAREGYKEQRGIGSESPSALASLLLRPLTQTSRRRSPFLAVLSPTLSLFLRASRPPSLLHDVLAAAFADLDTILLGVLGFSPSQSAAHADDLQDRSGRPSRAIGILSRSPCVRIGAQGGTRLVLDRQPQQTPSPLEHSPVRLPSSGAQARADAPVRVQEACMLPFGPSCDPPPNIVYARNLDSNALHMRLLAYRPREYDRPFCTVQARHRPFLSLHRGAERAIRHVARARNAQKAWVGQSSIVGGTTYRYVHARAALPFRTARTRSGASLRTRRRPICASAARTAARRPHDAPGPRCVTYTLCLTGRRIGDGGPGAAADRFGVRATRRATLRSPEAFGAVAGQCVGDLNSDRERENAAEAHFARSLYTDRKDATHLFLAFLPLENGAWAVLLRSRLYRCRRSCCGWFFQRAMLRSRRGEVVTGPARAAQLLEPDNRELGSASSSIGWLHRTALHRFWPARTDCRGQGLRTRGLGARGVPGEQTARPTSINRAALCARPLRAVRVLAGADEHRPVIRAGGRPGPGLPAADQARPYEADTPAHTGGLDLHAVGRAAGGPKMSESILHNFALQLGLRTVHIQASGLQAVWRVFSKTGTAWSTDERNGTAGAAQRCGFKRPEQAGTGAQPRLASSNGRRADALVAIGGGCKRHARADIARGEETTRGEGRGRRFAPARHSQAGCGGGELYVRRSPDSRLILHASRDEVSARASLSSRPRPLPAPMAATAPHATPVFVYAPGYYPLYAAMPEHQGAAFRTPFASVANTVSAGAGADNKPRKRMTAVQVSRMEALFAKTTHPSREARQAVATELHMDVRSVTVWLQNKRQSLKKAEDARRHNRAHNTAPPTRPSALRRTQSVPDATRGARQWQRTVSAPPPPRTLPRVSLDAFANRSAPSHVTPASAIARPATPPPPDSTLDIWDRMPSSPHAPPSSPANDLRRIAPLGPRRTLEWACAAERARFSDAVRHGRASSPELSDAGSDDTLEDDELRTPQSSVVIHAPVDKTVKVKTARPLAQPDSREEDVAEIMLLFATQRAH
uniref:HD protein 2-3 n=1 Tax=Auricularia cornea TaxID=1238391 RepID=A0A8K1X8N2_9AGAM|nr:HD protein 2-3 [Auricularia cornea]